MNNKKKIYNDYYDIKNKKFKNEQRNYLSDTNEILLNENIDEIDNENNDKNLAVDNNDLK